MSAMFALGINSAPYKIVVLAHIISSIGAFGSTLAYHSLAKLSPEKLKKVHNYTVLPALVLTWILGNAAVGLSEKFYVNEQGWVVASQILFLVAIGVAGIPLRGAIMKLVTQNTEANQKKVSMFTGILHLILTGLIVMMVFKFGAPDGLK